MKQQISLKLFVGVLFLLLLLILVVGYSFLSIYFFKKGVDSLTAAQMEDAARSYLQSVAPENRGQDTLYQGFHISLDWHSFPEELRSGFAQFSEGRESFEIRKERSIPGQRADYLTFMFRYEEEGEKVYVVRKIHRPKGPNLLGRNTHESQLVLVLISVAVAGVYAIALFFLYRTIAQPIALLGEWTRSLNPRNLDKPVPDFSFPELNSMGELVRSSLSSVQEGLEREHNFIRNASHELRTPIAVIRNNIELVPRLDQFEEPRKSDEFDQLLGRIDRASINMQHLTETLLWLYREDVDGLIRKDIALDQLLSQLIEELTYLLDRKEVELEVHTSPYTAYVPEIPTQIVLRNLVRNAFQHSYDGKITILQEVGNVTIINPCSDREENEENLGFGFGVQLIRQLTQKMGWQYTATREKAGYTASVSLSANDSLPKYIIT